MSIRISTNPTVDWNVPNDLDHPEENTPTTGTPPEPSVEQEAWNQRTRDLLERAYLDAGTGPGGSGCSHDAAYWEMARRPLAEGFHRSVGNPLKIPTQLGDAVGGSWLDVGCANGYLLETLPAWVAERGFAVEPYGLELIPSVADLARRRLPHWHDRIFTGDVMAWEPPRRFTFVTALADIAPDHRLGAFVRRLLDSLVEPGGRVIVSSYGSARRPEVVCHPIARRLRDLGFEVTGMAQATAPNGIVITRTAWVDAPRISTHSPEL